MELNVLKRILPSRTDDRPWYGRLGEGVTDTKVQALINAGYGYVLAGGTATTPITGAGAYVSTTPDMDILVPTAKAFIPLVVSVEYETIGTSLLLEVIVQAGLGGTFATGGTAITPVNMDSSRGNESGLSCQSPASSAVLPTTRVTEIFHATETLAITKTAGSATVAAFDRNTYVYRAREEGCYHIIKGAEGLFARMNVWGASQGPTLFILVKGLCVPEEWTRE